MTYYAHKNEQDKTTWQMLKEHLRLASQDKEIEALPDVNLLLYPRNGDLGNLQYWMMQYESHSEALEPGIFRNLLAQKLRKLTYQEER